MKYFLWRIRHIHSNTIVLRRGRTAFCPVCNAHFNLNK